MSSKNYDKFFHAYDIRGLVSEGLDDGFFYRLGKAFVYFLKAKKVCVGRDIRVESQKFEEAFIKGAREMGVEITDIGQVATEMIYYAVGSDLSFDGGAVITASHNPAGWNGCKMVGKQVSAISETSGLMEIKKLMDDDLNEDRDIAKGLYSQIDIYNEFKNKILSVLKGIDIRPIRVVVDARNGIGGIMFEKVFSNLGLDVIPMYFEADGTFPNHVPDPLKEENVEEIKKKVVDEKADLGIAIDGDGDRVFFIDNRGRNPCGVYTGAVFCRYLLEENKDETIVHDPKVYWSMKSQIDKYGGIAVASKTGHSFFKEKMKETGALFGAEMSSHFFYRDFFGADSGMMTIAYMLKFISQGLNFSKELDFYYKNFPISGEINFEVNDNQTVLGRVSKYYSDQGGQLETIDGISFSFSDWRFNLRQSNTQPLIRLNMEARNEKVIVDNFLKLKELIGGKIVNLPSLKSLQLLI